MVNLIVHKPAIDVKSFVPTKVINSVLFQTEDELLASKFEESHFDNIYLYVFDKDVNLSNVKLSEILRVLKVGGEIFVDSVDGESLLKLNGLSDVRKCDGNHNEIVGSLKNSSSLVVGKKSVQVGAKIKLNLGKKQAVSDDVKKAWQLPLDDTNGDFINEDDLLEESDFQQPDKAMMCGPSGDSGTKKKRACKDCSCGLKEELENENGPKEVKKSSCGSCYLGDAFRCASCPYAGLPAFKPGEEVKISEQFLKSDL